MAHTKQAKKRIRQDEKRTLRNRSRMSKVKTAVKKYESQVDSGDSDAAKKLLSAASSELDRAAKRNIIHPNAAARKKSRLAKKLARASS